MNFLNRHTHIGKLCLQKRQGREAYNHFESLLNTDSINKRNLINFMSIWIHGEFAESHIIVCNHDFSYTFEF